MEHPKAISFRKFTTENPEHIDHVHKVLKTLIARGYNRSILKYILENPGISSSDLSERLDISIQSTRRTLSELLKKEIITFTKKRDWYKLREYSLDLESDSGKFVASSIDYASKRQLKAEEENEKMANNLLRQIFLSEKNPKF